MRNTKKEFRIWDGSKMNHDILVGILGVFSARIDPNDSACAINTKYTIEMSAMQYVGIRDKNGTKIFEGDIFKSLHNSLGNLIKIPTLVYEDLRWCLEEKSPNEKPNNYEYLDHFEGQDLEVIGNIHEDIKK